MEKIDVKQMTKNISYIRIFITFFSIFIGLVIITIPFFNGLTREHDREMATNIGTLMVEKMNNSIEYMAMTVQNSADLVGAHDIMDMDSLYKELQASLDNASYSSIGLVNPYGHLYSTYAEHGEFEKWGLLDLAGDKEGVRISEPYRSTSTGRMVITFMSSIYKQDSYVGTLFVTYPLEEIQNLAKTEVFKEDAEIYLMNPYSDNCICCASGDPTSVGSWDNMKLYYGDIINVNGESYDAWKENMLHNNREEKSVNFYLSDTLYTQVFSKIDLMDRWYIVVRVPSSKLSNTLSIFKSIAFLLVTALAISAVIIFFIIRKKEEKEKEDLEIASTHDHLTGLYNRRAFTALVDARIKDYPTSKGVMMFTDIDHFKQVNDTFGHDIGDKLLCHYATAISDVFEENAIVARFGGDEFVCYIYNYDDRAEIDYKMEVLKRKLETFSFENSTAAFELHYSAGLATYPEVSSNIEKLLKVADDSLYYVKKNGRNGYKWFDQITDGEKVNQKR